MTPDGWVPVPPRPVFDVGLWRSYSSDELAELKPYDKVYGLCEEWRDKKKTFIITEGYFVSYSSGRGIVELQSTESGCSLSYCDRNVGALDRYEIERMHEMTGYDS
jgi:hypothetical protein